MSEYISARRADKKITMLRAYKTEILPSEQQSLSGEQL